MKERPIIFSSDMVRATLDGRKTQTRRVCYGQRELSNLHDFQLDKCPYGQPGDILYVRESFIPNYFDDGSPGYKANWTETAADLIQEPKWRPSIHMPKSAARLWLRVTDVRVERVQDITVKDIKDEGIGNIVGIPEWDSAEWEKAYTTRFAELWDSINAKRGYSWKSDPWVWVVNFKRTYK